VAHKQKPIVSIGRHDADRARQNQVMGVTDDLGIPFGIEVVVA